MTQNSKENIVCLEAASPKELAELLKGLPKDKAGKSRFVSLNVYGPQILVRQFDLPRLNPAELKNALRLEAVELLHLKPQEIEFDYQILSSSKDKINGIFVALPKKLLEEYASCCDKAQLMLSSVTASSISAVNSFFCKNKAIGGTFSLLVFSERNHIYLSVFDNRLCVLLREIYYENLNQAEQEVINSLKYSCARSVNKQLDTIYCSGEVSDKDELIARLEKVLDVSVQKGDFTGKVSCAPWQEGFFKINLMKRYCLTINERIILLKAENLALALCLFLCVALGVKVIKDRLSIRQARSSFTLSDYDYAKKLLEKIK